MSVGARVAAGTAARPSVRGEVLVASLGIAGMVAAVWWIWTIVGMPIYAGADGKGFQANVLTYLNFARACESSTINPLQGMANQLKPINLCFNLGYLPFLALDFAQAMVVGALLSLATLAAATYVVGRSFGLGIGSSLLGAQSTCLVAAPFVLWTGFASQFALVPATAFSLGLLMLASCLPGLVRRPALAPIVAVGLAVALAVGAIAYVDPFLIVGITLALGTLWAAQALSGDWRIALARIGALLLALALLYAAGILDFLRLFAQYTARWYFHAESSRSQVELATIVLQHPSRAPATMAILAAGWVLLLALGRGRQRLLALAAFAQTALVWLLTAVMLLDPTSRPLPAPMYFELFAMPAMLLAAMAGYAHAIGRVAGRWTPPRATGLLAVAAGQAFLGYFALDLAPHFKDRMNERFPDDGALVTFLEKDIGLAAGTRFNGLAAFTISSDPYDDLLTKINLRRRSIPALDEYGQQVTPQIYYFFSRVLSSSAAPMSVANSVYLTWAKSHILAAMGVRYLLTPPVVAATDIPGATRRDRLFTGATASGGASQWRLWELPNPNLGQYSPTEATVERSADVILAALNNRNFDFRYRALVSEPIAGPLTEARNARMTAERGSIRVEAESDGRSLLLLPLQFSHCWAVDSDAPVRLVRTDFLFTGLVFDRRVDARLSLGFGVLSPGCRRADLAAMRAAGVRATSLRQESTDRQFAAFYPYAARSWSDLPDALRRIAARVAAIRRAECSDDPPAPGPVSSWLAPWGIAVPSLRLCAP